MATTILAAGVTAALTTDVILAQGIVESIGMFAAGALPTNVRCAVLMDNPGTTDTLVGYLTSADPVLVVTGPGTFRVSRPACTVAVGIYTGS